MLGQVGNDTEGQNYIKYLKENNVDESNVIIKDNCFTGSAIVLTVAPDGNKSIISVGGAN